MDEAEEEIELRAAEFDGWWLLLRVDERKKAGEGERWPFARKGVIL